ncbi:hypothetical protein N7495_006347 [Penicillium taxi]|uniref:uncharacterized protein n=1 Tax=Penicillium taxi TaxID=168475 RepID=UPI0025459BD1|nr:uncharacterized protein N7495_006347 [Penicillium taxi]KAJ5894656.1 hypothetical protein N7495_006347 [Penicillium taxi]
MSAPSWRELMNHIFNDIAHRGPKGSTVSQILLSISKFYDLARQEDSWRMKVDRCLQVKVWELMTKSEECLVGENRRWNHLSLDEIEELEAKLEAGIVPDQAVPEASTATEQAAPEASIVTKATVTAPESLKVRIFVCETRTWLAVAGHERDDAMIPYHEFALLCFIASYGSKGIPQSDLIKTSAQDKRSVPKRTDALERKGYIQKRHIQYNGARTSLCTLLQFLDEPGGASTQVDVNRLTEAGGRIIDFETFNDKLFSCLMGSANWVVAREDLKVTMGFDDRWRWRILSRALRRYEQLGLIVRIRAKSQYEHNVPCVKLIREPTSTDLDKFIRDSISWPAEADAMDFDKDGDSDDDETADPMYFGEGWSASTRTVPCWTPYRIISNQFFDVIQRSGLKGVTNMDINRILFGDFFRRPAEYLITRLVDCWQLAQPPHLRHLAIVRDTSVRRTITCYVHYTRDNFARLVEMGEASWEAVEWTTKKALQPAGLIIHPPNATGNFDKYGLPKRVPAGILNGGNVSYAEALWFAKPVDYSVTSSDPKPFIDVDGNEGVLRGRIKATAGTIPEPIVDTENSGRRYRGKGKKLDHDCEDTSKLPAVILPRVRDREIIDKNGEIWPKSLRWTPGWDDLPLKEKFEAIKMDDTWTEYNAITMDKPTPGVYVTARGKRKPRDGVQGRPKVSRLAVFKSPRLLDLPWFVREKPVLRPQKPEKAETVTGKHRLEEPITEKLRKKRRFSNIDAADHAQTSTGESEIQVDTPMDDAPTKIQTLTGEPSIQVDTPTDETPLGDTLIDETPIDETPIDETPIDETPIDETPIDETPMELDVPGPSNLGSIAANPSSAVDLPSTDRVTSSLLKKVLSSPMKGGSISIFRRKILMEIVDKAGGAYPSGNEMWYPFTSAWLRRFRSKPDLKTVKASLKYLVDAGLLKQMTFSGKDSRGIMTTKTLVMRSEMSADDPWIIELKRKMLEADRYGPNIAYSDNVLVDQSLSRRSSHVTTGRHKQAVPVETGLTVNVVSKKPSYVLRAESRQERKVQRMLVIRQREELARWAKEAAAETAEQYENGPYQAQGHRQFARLNKLINAKDPMYLLMNPRQIFRDDNGTFGTFSLRYEKNKFSFDPAKLTQELIDIREHRKRDSFYSRAHRILQWELEHEEILDEDLRGTRSIDLTVDAGFHGVEIPEDIRFDSDRLFTKSILLTQRMQSRTYKQPHDRSSRSSDRDNPAAANRRKQAFFSNKAPLRRKVLPTLAENMVRRIMVAIVAVRTLAGGDEGKVVNWEYATLAFPNSDPELIKSYGKSIMTKNRLELHKMQRDFQMHFLEAYEKDELPVIDYRKLHLYEWGTIVDWASHALEFTVQKIPNLPATIEQFDSMFGLRDEPVAAADEVHQTVAGMTIAHKRDLMAHVPFAIMHTRDIGPRKEEMVQFDIAKTWIRANAFTSDEHYNASLAVAKLGSLSEDLLRRATQSLFNERVITHTNRGRPVPGRNYLMNEHFMSGLERKRAIDAQQLRCAAQYKLNVIDPALKTHGFLKANYHSKDGDSLALCELVAAGHIELTPIDPPMAKFGLTEGGYLTRQIDRNLLRFMVEIRPSPSYVYGNPVTELAHGFRPPTPPPNGMIPLWYDFHDNLRTDLWEKCVASVLGCLVLRPGSTAQIISNTLKPTMGAWEIELIMAWLTSLDVVRGREGGGWLLKEWWWLSLGLSYQANLI